MPPITTNSNNSAGISNTTVRDRRRTFFWNVLCRRAYQKRTPLTFAILLALVLVVHFKTSSYTAPPEYGREVEDHRINIHNGARAAEEAAAALIWKENSNDGSKEVVKHVQTTAARIEQEQRIEQKNTVIEKVQEEKEDDNESGTDAQIEASLASPEEAPKTEETKIQEHNNASSILSLEHFRKQGSKYARAFSPWSSEHHWCKLIPTVERKGAFLFPDNGYAPGENKVTEGRKSKKQEGSKGEKQEEQEKEEKKGQEDGRGKEEQEEKTGRSLFHGLVFVALPKAGSTTIAGVIFRIAHQHGQTRYTLPQSSNTDKNNNEQPSLMCNFIQAHAFDAQAATKYRNRDRSKTFFFSVVRDPASRALSRVFFSKISQGGKEPTNRVVMNQLRSRGKHFGAVGEGEGGFQLRYLTNHTIERYSAWKRDNPTVVVNPEQIEKHVAEIMETYDLLMVNERMDESLVVLQLLLNLNTGDILYTNNKVAGSSYLHTKKGCIKLQKSFRSEVVKNHLSSDEWFAKNYGDYVLYHAANASLDLTIEKLGRDKFEKALAEFRRLKALEVEQCTATTMLQCSADGVPQKEKSDPQCYFNDRGCGFPCIDRIVQEYGKKETE